MENLYSVADIYWLYNATDNGNNIPAIQPEFGAKNINLILI